MPKLADTDAEALLKTEAQAELHAPGANERTGYPPEAGAGHTQVRGPILCVIPGVEHLPSELRVEPLPHAGILEDPEIPIVDTRLFDGVPAGIAFHVTRRAGGVARVIEGSRVDIGVRQAASRHVRSDDVGPRRREGADVHPVYAHPRARKLTFGKRGDARDLPATQNLAANATTIQEGLARSERSADEIL